ncbi:MAG: siderophore-interacting protein [Pseudomonadota bacterium]
MSVPHYPYQARADLPGIPFRAMRQAILTHAKSRNLEVLEDEQTHLTVQTAHGLIGLRPGDAAEAAGMVAAEDARWLFAMKNAVITQIRQVIPEVAEAMRWSDGDVEGTAPPNFQTVRVTDVVALGPVFVRVTLSGKDLSSYTTNSIHFRLLQPPKGSTPLWPVLAANGSTKWPDGPGAVHKPVYTARSVDHDANTLITDIFLHEGGRTTAWAQNLMSGDPSGVAVAIVGPSGGGLLHANRVLMASDETGFPAAARLLEHLPADATGELLLEADDGEHCAYPMPPAPTGVSIRWLKRSAGERLADASIDALARHSIDASIWFAGERGEARRLRDAAKTAGWATKALRISGFWRAGHHDA